VDPQESQYERTRLAWRRTILAVLVIAGLGAMHLATAGLVREASLFSALTLAAVAPAAHRLRALRHEVPVATWQPAMLTVVACLMAAVAFVPN
jgi:Na+/H+ antiporter NhaB